MMRNTLNYLLNDPDPKASALVPQLMNAIDGLEKQIKELEFKISDLKRKIKHVYSDLNQIEYKLHAVFMHEGEASFGHYWLYLSDSLNRKWTKYNDSVVESVSNSVVFQNSSGKTANVYALAYISSNVPIQLSRK